MKILVCVKQIPDMESKFKVNAQGTWYEESDLALRMNEYDEYAVEQAVQIKEQQSECDVTVLSIGGATVTEVLKKALAMGCNRAVHIRDDNMWQKDAAQIAAIIAGFARDKQFDLILTGMQSQDRGSAQVGVLVAEKLEIACTTTIVDFEYTERGITIKRELEGGMKGVVELSLPALITCQLGLNTPRYPTLPNIMKAKRKELLSFDVADFATDVPALEVVSMYPPQKKGGGLILEGETDDLAEKLVTILKERRVA